MQSDLLEHLAPDSLLERLAELHIPGNQDVTARGGTHIAHHQQLVPICHGNDDGRADLRIFHLTA